MLILYIILVAISYI